MKKHVFLLFLVLYLLLSGCFAHTVGVTTGRIVATPIEKTLDFTFGFIEGFFGGAPQEQGKEKTNPLPPTNDYSTDSTKGKLKRDRLGNLLF